VQRATNEAYTDLVQGIIKLPELLSTTVCIYNVAITFLLISFCNHSHHLKLPCTKNAETLEITFAFSCINYIFIILI